MKIHIEDLKFQTIIGILDFERQTPQDVILNLEIEYSFADEFINYAEVADLLKELLIKEQFLLIEDALTKSMLKLKEKFPAIQSLNLKITKPSILPDCKVSVSDFKQFHS